MILVILSPVNATEFNETTDNNLTINFNTSHDILKSNSGDFSTLYDEINSSSQSKSLKLTKDYIFDSQNDLKYTEGIPIEIDNLVIDGNGHKIDADKKSIVFNIKSNNVLLKNIIITNGTSNYHGGAINWIGTNATLINSTFKNSEAAQSGGAVFFRNTATVKDCKFIDNQANFGGAINFDYISTVINSSFKNNFAKLLGGGINSYQEINLLNSIFINNSASDGGGIYSNIYGIIENTYFNENYAIGYGGAITSANTIKIRNSTFTNNIGKYAGAICFKGDGYLNNSFFNENSADLGGAIMASGYDFETSYCEFYHNTAMKGASLYCDGKNMKIKDTIFKNVNSTLKSEIYSETQNSILNNLTYHNITKKSESAQNEIKNNLLNKPLKTNSKKKTTIIAKSKTFKYSIKIKKYFVKLKSGKKILKNKKVTLKIKGKTYRLKTNKNGKALFKIKLTKKGIFKALIKFNGDKTYYSSKKTIKIKIK